MKRLREHKLNELYSISSGLSSTPKQAGHGAPFLSFKCIFNNYFIPDTIEEYMDTAERDQEKYSIKKGDVFLTRTSETLDELGMSCAAIKDYDKATFSGFSKRLRPIQTDTTYDKFMGFFFRSNYFREIINKKSVMTLRASLNETIFSHIKVWLIDYPDQEHIGDFLYLLEEKIKLNNKLNEELERLSKLFYEHWFLQYDFPDKDGRPYKTSGGKMVWNPELKRKIPAGWTCCTLSKILSRISTGLNPRDNFKLGSGSNYYVTIKNIDNGKIFLDNKCDKISDEALQIINKRSDLQAGDILFTSIEPVGVTYLIQDKPENWNINESVFSLRPDYNLVTSEYAYLLLSGAEIKSFTKNVSAGSIHKGVRIGVLNTFKVAYRDKDIISQFSNIVAPILKQINTLNKESQKLAELRDWLLPMFINGQATLKQTFHS